MSDEVIRHAALVLKKHHFTRKGSTWYFDESDTILVVNFQREFGEQYFINAAVWIKKLGADVMFPKEHHSQIRARLSCISREYENKAAFLNIRKHLSSSTRQEKIEIALEKSIIPFLFRYNTLKKICNAMPKLTKKGYLAMPVQTRQKFAKLCNRSSWDELIRGE